MTRELLAISYKPSSEATPIRLVKEGKTRLVEKDGALGLELGYEVAKIKNATSVLRLLRSVIREARKYELIAISISISEVEKLPKFRSLSQPWEAFGRELEVANYEFGTYKTDPKLEEVQLGKIVLLGKHDKSLERRVERGQVIGQSINWSREMANRPANRLSALQFYRQAHAFASGTDARVRQATLSETEDMGLFNGVAAAAPEQALFMITEYWGTSKKVAPVVLVGKGIIYDTGGLSLKPSEHMLGMHLDMSGAAAATAVVIAAAKLGLKRNVVALTPLTENAISATATRPGDILTSLSGKTVEDNNTDAEGRLVLADALTFAKHYKPAFVVSIATLTGAAVVALGKYYSALFTDNRKLRDSLLAAGLETANPLWHLPAGDGYVEELMGKRADVTNISNNPASRYGGASLAATFLQQFAEGYDYAHLDIAPRDESIPLDNLAEHSTGEPVALLIETLQR